MDWTEAMNIAEAWRMRLRPHCVRIEVAGSLRRKKAEVKDIELVAIPKVTEEINLFGEVVRKASHLEGLDWEPARIIKGGERYKQLALPEGINLDLFIVLPPAQWGVIFALRTGPADFSKWVVTPRVSGGRLPMGCKVIDGHVYDYWTGRGVIVMEEEIDFLAFLGLGWIEPEERRVR